MKYTLAQLQKELILRTPDEIADIAMKLAKYKKENKEYLTYLLFGVEDEKQYIQESKLKLDDLFYEINRKSAYTTKKGLQKVVRNLTKFIKNSKLKQTELELRIHFCNKVKSTRINLDVSNVISNIYYREIDKIKLAYSKLHEDLQYDYKVDLEKLNINIV
ncbi:MAG: hypothetical protein JNL69_06075 [Bacteroidia bacterium]|nr:hypothetical protein [Bacteroidia bacterium]